MRDLRAGYNAITSDWSAPAAKNATYAFVDNAWWYDESNKAYYNRLLNAVRNGDTKTASDLISYLTESKGMDENKVRDNVRNDVIKGLVQSGEMGTEEAVNLIADHFPLNGGVKAAYKKVNEWLDGIDLEEGEKANTTGYSKLDDAMLAGDAAAYTAAKNELLRYGFTDKQIADHAESLATSAYKNGEMTWDKAKNIYKRYAGITDENELFWKKEKLDYKGEGNWTEYQPARDTLLAGDKKGFLSEKSKLLSHGKTGKGVIGSIDALKDELLDMYDTDPAAARQLRAMIVWAYMECGLTKDSANKKIDGWFN
jgi:polyhydroxyalkanoate synthesis regulator phasin